MMNIKQKCESRNVELVAKFKEESNYEFSCREKKLKCDIKKI